MTKIKVLNEPSKKPAKTRRRNAIAKTYQYHYGVNANLWVPITLPIFRAKLINAAISHEQTITLSGLSANALKRLSEFCETKQASPRQRSYIKRWIELFAKIFGFNECDFNMAVFSVDDTDWTLEEL